MRISHGQQAALLALAGGLPAVVAALFFLWHAEASRTAVTVATIAVAGAWLGFAAAVHVRVVRPLQTIANLLLALREEDFSIQARVIQRGDPLGDVWFELNALAQILREQRLGALEATALLRAVMEEISVAVFTFDQDHRLRLVNRAGERLLGRPAERLLGQTAAELGLADCLLGEPVRTLQTTFAGALGKWGMRRNSFRQRGRPHQLVVLADLSRALREEERQAWQRLLRVLGHELNNSLAPIKSISGSLKLMFARETLPEDWRQDLEEGLAVIGSRTEALGRFMEAYARLARLPPPKLQPVEVAPLAHRVLGLELRLKLDLLPGPNLTLQADPDQLEQLLINLVRNAVDAALETKGGVHFSWGKVEGQLEIRIEDDGPGLANTSNLFVPFFTTKPGGSGIGLALSRQIAEGHGGTLTLENRSGARGGLARLRLPL